MTPDLDEVEAFLGLISYEDWVAQGEAPPGGGKKPSRRATRLTLGRICSRKHDGAFRQVWTDATVTSCSQASPARRALWGPQRIGLAKSCVFTLVPR